MTSQFSFYLILGVLLSVILTLQITQSTNLQKIEMSRSNFAEMKNGVIFCRKVINQGFWCNDPLNKYVS